MSENVFTLSKQPNDNSPVFPCFPCQVLIIAHVTAEMVTLTRHEKEKYFLTVTGEKELFPSLHDASSRELSVVIPAYNEELRSECLMMCVRNLLSIQWNGCRLYPIIPFSQM